jgi:hypothetical protein
LGTTQVQLSKPRVVLDGSHPPQVAFPLPSGLLTVPEVEFTPVLFTLPLSVLFRAARFAGGTVWFDAGTVVLRTGMVRLTGGVTGAAGAAAGMARARGGGKVAMGGFLSRPMRIWAGVEVSGREGGLVQVLPTVSLHRLLLDTLQGAAAR